MQYSFFDEEKRMSPSKNPLKNLNPSAKYAIIELKEEGNKNAVQLF